MQSNLAQHYVAAVIGVVNPLNGMKLTGWISEVCPGYSTGRDRPCCSALTFDCRCTQPHTMSIALRAMLSGVRYSAESTQKNATLNICSTQQAACAGTAALIIISNEDFAERLSSIACECVDSLASATCQPDVQSSSSILGCQGHIQGLISGSRHTCKGRLLLDGSV